MKKLLGFFTKNYLLTIFLGIIVFVGFISIYRLFYSKPTYVYVKVKVGQGMWWASTIKPSNWFIQGLKKGMKEEDLTGKSVAEILSVKYYPWNGLNQYDIYLTLKLKVSGNKKTNSYSFNRSSIGVGSPIDFEFPEAQFSGTVIALSQALFVDKYEEKIIYLYNQNSLPFEYDAIKIGDYYFDGEDRVFEILDKSMGESHQVSSSVGNLLQVRSITVKAKIRVKKENERYIFGEERIVSPAKPLNIAANNFQFSDYVVSEIE